MESDRVLRTSDETFEREVLESPLPVLVDFWASACGPCRAAEPTVQALAERYQGRLTVAALNTDDHLAIPQELGVRALPTFLLFKQGKVVGQLVGNHPKSLEDLVARHLG